MNLPSLATIYVFGHFGKNVLDYEVRRKFSDAWSLTLPIPSWNSLWREHNTERTKNFKKGIPSGTWESCLPEHFCSYIQLLSNTHWSWHILLIASTFSLMKIFSYKSNSVCLRFCFQFGAWYLAYHDKFHKKIKIMLLINIFYGAGVVIKPLYISPHLIHAKVLHGSFYYYSVLHMWNKKRISYILVTQLVHKGPVRSRQ